MSLDTIGRSALFVDLIALVCLIAFVWLDLRRQTTDVGKVGGVTVLVALCFVFYFIGRAFLAR